MPKKDAKLASGQGKPEDRELSLDDEMLVKYLEKNLAIVLDDTAQKTAELKRLQKVKKQLLDHKYNCLTSASKVPFSEDMNLLPRLNQVNSKVEELVKQVKGLIEAKAEVDKAYDKHCNDAKRVTAAHLKSRYDQYTTMPSEELEKIIGETKMALKETVAKTDAIKAELATKKREYQAKYLAMMKEVEILTQVEQDAVERLEQLRLEDALSK